MKLYLYILIIFTLYYHCEKINYINPIINEDTPEPSVIKGKDNNYYLFTTFEKFIAVRI